jgi:hypothetical protein
MELNEATDKSEATNKSEATDKQSQMADTIRLVDIKVDSELVALNVMVQFLTLAHKRGAFTIEESSKIWECIKMFQKPM